MKRVTRGSELSCRDATKRTARPLNQIDENGPYQPVGLSEGCLTAFPIAAVRLAPQQESGQDGSDADKAVPRLAEKSGSSSLRAEVLCEHN
jgi:hypothetical protein